MNIGHASGTVMVGLGLLVFGVAYNAVVAWFKRHGYDEGYMSLLVAAGVGATLAGVAVVDWHAAVLALAAFCLSGLPMAAGSVWRHVRAREHSQNAIRREVLR